MIVEEGYEAVITDLGAPLQFFRQRFLIVHRPTQVQDHGLLVFKRFATHVGDHADGAEHLRLSPPRQLTEHPSIKCGPAVFGPKSRPLQFDSLGQAK